MYLSLIGGGCPFLWSWIDKHEGNELYNPNPSYFHLFSGQLPWLEDVGQKYLCDSGIRNHNFHIFSMNLKINPTIVPVNWYIPDYVIHIKVFIALIDFVANHYLPIRIFTVLFVPAANNFFSVSICSIFHDSVVPEVRKSLLVTSFFSFVVPVANCFFHFNVLVILDALAANYFSTSRKVRSRPRGAEFSSGMPF